MTKYSLKLPMLIEKWDTAGAVEVLQKYYGARYPVPGEPERTPYTGAWFDGFDPSGTRSGAPNDFTADDLVSVALLSTPNGNRAAKSLLLDEGLKEEINLLLAETDRSDRIWDVEEEVEASWSLWKLETLLVSSKVKGVRVTRASKLIARKRPHLYPIVDSVVLDLVRPNKLPQGWSFLKALQVVFQYKTLRSFLKEVRKRPDYQRMSHYSESSMFSPGWRERGMGRR